MALWQILCECENEDKKVSTSFKSTQYNNGNEISC